MVSTSLRKKSDKVHRSCSTVFVTWRRSAKNSFFMWTRLHWRHMPSTFATQQSCNVLHSTTWYSVDAPLGCQHLSQMTNFLGSNCHLLLDLQTSFWIFFHFHWNGLKSGVKKLGREHKGVLFTKWQRHEYALLCLQSCMQNVSNYFSFRFFLLHLTQYGLASGRQWECICPRR